MELFKAASIALSAVQSLNPYCNKVNVAGSIRREKSEVKDIEIVVIPNKIAITGIFGPTGDFDVCPKFCNAAMSLGKVVEGIPRGRHMKIDLPEGIRLDLFMPEDYDWARQYAIRTGSAEYSYRTLAKAWVKLGWVGTENGLRLADECVKVADKWQIKPEIKALGSFYPTKPPVWKTEEEFFAWLNLEWKAPRERYLIEMEN